MPESFTMEVQGFGDKMYPKNVFKETVWGLDFRSKDVTDVKFAKYFDAKKVKVTLEVIE